MQADGDSDHAQHARELHEQARRNGQVERLLKQLDAAWTALGDSYAGLAEARLVEPGVVDDWSVKDILAHVTTWEEEALQHLPLIIAGGTPPRYAAQGGIDAFNARATEAGRRRSLAEVLRRRGETHARLVDFIRRQPAGTFGGRTRARRRLRLDTYGHYPEHTAAIQTWREAHQTWPS
ncbi:MAG TPA: maleylpyruvate isomerase N-terminal domain-containing protein [Actinomycetota bacterium]|nr:maleylpyruvate isomerase N-terminal domain-containing protein [Actinomycetota bacterium]